MPAGLASPSGVRETGWEQPVFIKELALEGKHPGESPGEAAGTGEAGFPGRFRQQDLGSLKLVEAENLIALITAVPWFLVFLCIDGQRLNGFNIRAEMLEAAPAIRSPSGQGCVSSRCDAPRTPFPKPSGIRKAGK